VHDAPGSLISPDRLVDAVGAAVQPTGPWQLAFPSFRGIARRTWEMDQYAAHLGGSGGAGLAYGPAATVGAALARKDDDTLVVGLQPDGDLLYAPMALWTAAHHELPLLMVVENNKSYGADRLHQARIGRLRNRSEDKVSVGIDLEDPAVDIAGLTRAQGVRSWSVGQRAGLEETLAEAVSFVRDKQQPGVVVVDVERPERAGLG
jgi:benzoylformate decarboxylase/acetolactate synthase-1/2/3 large subunit